MESLSTIKSPEISPERQKLADLEAERKYLFHGSPDELEELEPRQALNYKGKIPENDGDPAIFAAPIADYSIMMAIINKKNFPNYYNSKVTTNGRGDGSFGYTFHATQRTLDQLNGSLSGYVYVFDKSKFLPGKPGEYISYEPVSPVEVIKVTEKDLPTLKIIE